MGYIQFNPTCPSIPTQQDGWNPIELTPLQLNSAVTPERRAVRTREKVVIPKIMLTLRLLQEKSRKLGMWNKEIGAASDY